MDVAKINTTHCVRIAESVEEKAVVSHVDIDPFLIRRTASVKEPEEIASQLDGI